MKNHIETSFIKFLLNYDNYIKPQTEEESDTETNADTIVNNLIEKFNKTKIEYENIIQGNK